MKVVVKFEGWSDCLSKNPLISSRPVLTVVDLPPWSNGAQGQDWVVELDHVGGEDVCRSVRPG